MDQKAADELAGGERRPLGFLFDQWSDGWICIEDALWSAAIAEIVDEDVQSDPCAGYIVAGIGITVAYLGSGGMPRSIPSAGYPERPDRYGSSVWRGRGLQPFEAFDSSALSRWPPPK